MTRGGGWRQRWRLLALAALLTVVLLVPVERYRPCFGDRWYGIYLNGPMRDEYVGYLTEEMASDGFSYIRVGNEVFIKLVYLFHVFNRPPKWDSLGEFLINSEHKIASSIANGYDHKGRVELPAKLREVRAEANTLFEEEKARRPGERKWKEFSDYAYDFELFRATVIRVEDMDPDDMLYFIPKNPLPADCDFFHLRAWSRYCGKVVRGTGEKAAVVREAKGR